MPECVAIVVVDEPSIRRDVVARLRSTHSVLLSSRTEVAAVALSQPRVDVVIIEAIPRRSSATRHLVQRVVETHPSCKVVVGLHDSDTDGVWRSFVAGADPYPLSLLATTSWVLPASGGDGVDRLSIARASIEDVLRGRPLDAYGALTHVRSVPDVLAVLDAYSEMAARAIQDVATRTPYLISSDVVLRWLDERRGADFDACWTMLQRAVFRAGGLDLELTEPVVALAPRPLLDGGLQVAVGLVRFAARRRWRRPLDLLADVTSWV